MTPSAKHLCRWMLVAAIAIAPAGCAGTPEPITLAVEGRANATPSMAASGSLVVVVWGAAGTDRSIDVYASVSRDRGTRFNEPVRVSSAATAQLNGEQPPRVTLLERPDRDPAIVVVWTATGAQGTTLLQSRSDDGGMSFGPQTLVAGTDAAGNRGWEAIASGANGRVAAVWLDHRESAATEGTAHRHHGETAAAGGTQESSDGALRAQMSKLYFGWLNEGSPQPITGGVCYCCKTTLATAPNGSIYAAWRHVYPGNVRDIAFTSSRDGGRTFAAPTRISEDSWVLDGCPENGPSLAVGDDRRIHVAWPTLIDSDRGEPALALFYATSPDGRAFTPRQPIPTDGVPRHVQIVAAPGGHVVAAWDEGNEGARRLVFARGAPETSGVMRFTRVAYDRDSAATYPVLTTVGNDVLAAWTSGGANDSVIRIQRLLFSDR